jgi:O-antigen ligase
MREKGFVKIKAAFPLLIGLGGIVAMLFAVSEGGMIGAIAGIIVFSLLLKQTRVAGLVAIIAASIVIIAHPPLTNYASRIIALQDDSGSVRKIIWQESSAMIQDHPVFGAGLSSYPAMIAPYHEAKHIEIFQYPHNLFLNFWSETGLIGLIGFLWLVSVFFIQNFKLWKRNDIDGLPIALIAAMITILVHGLVDVPYMKNDLAFLFWIMIGLTESMRREALQT